MLLHVLALLLPLILVAGEPNRKLLDGLEFSLVFPRNETYAPTGYFPLVLAVRNPVDIWPLGFKMSVEVLLRNETVPPINGYFNFPKNEYYEGPSPSSAPYHFFIAGTDALNGTTGQFEVRWDFLLPHACRAMDNKDYGFTSDSYSVAFTLAHGAPLPDIEAAVNRCPNSTAFLKPFGFNADAREDGDCPVVNSSFIELPPVPDPCLVKPHAKELAHNVSTAMLGLLGCPDGEWQTIKQPCPPKNSGGSQRGSSVVEAALILLLGILIWNIL